MNEIDEGPCRRVSRHQRRREANNTGEKNTGAQASSNIKTKVKQSTTVAESLVNDEAKAEWFDDSFSDAKSRRSSCVRVSTPKRSRKQRKVSIDSDGLNTSDTMFAELDLEKIVSQSKTLGTSSSDCSVDLKTQTSQVEQHSSSTLNGTRHNIDSEKTLSDVSMSETLQSQYFPAKFGNYRSTQPGQNGVRHEVIIANTVTGRKQADDTSFSFSFVETSQGNNTFEIPEKGRVGINGKCSVSNIVEESRNVLKGNKVRRNSKEVLNGGDGTKGTICSEKLALSQTCLSKSVITPVSQHKSPEANAQVLSTTQWNTRDLVSSTQLCDSQDREHIRFRCTPFKRQSQAGGESQPEFDITLLKDHDRDTHIRSTPFVKAVNGVTCTLNETQINGETKFQCTPYNRDKDMCSETQSLCVTVSQYRSGGGQDQEIEESQLVSTAHCISLDTARPLGTQYDSQIPATGLCEMTGLIVDSQVKGAGRERHQSGDSDIFSDSLHDSVFLTQDQELDNNVDNKTHMSTRKDQPGEKNSSTSHLKLNDKMSRTKSQKRSLDDDIESIFQASQTRRNSAKKAKNKVNSGSVSLRDVTNEVVANILPMNSKYSANDEPDNVSVTGAHVQAEAVSFGARMKSGSATGMLETGLPKTPEATSLQDRIKQKLKGNVGQKSPHAPGHLTEQLRARALEQVRLEGERLQAGPDTDIGPFYGLPSKVKQLFETYRGITSLYSWQEECLKLPALQERRNLIYSLPTSGGKTLVAEILILQELLCHKRDALLILPFVSIVQEKVRNMAQFAVDLDFHVEEYAGSKGRFPPLSRRKSNSLYIATIEKAHSIVNSLTEADRMDKLGLVVVDELHMIGEGGSRGATLESTLMKILHAAGPTQIIGMSATLSNIGDLTTFLKADIYSNDFRPVKLTEYIKLSENIYRTDPAAKCPDDQIIHDRVTCFQYAPEMEKTDPDHLLGLVLEIIPDNSCLVFCPTKKNCENVALMLCKLMAKYRRELSKVKHKERKDLLKELYNDSDGRICPVLQYTVQFGVAYHHSGLTGDERRLVEEAYSAGTLCMLTCTSTLAAGVNLPAKRVILRSPYVGQYFISRSQYKQMVGRAGRAGIDSSGESVVICKPGDREKVLNLLSAPLERCHSSLIYDGAHGMRSLILSTIGLKITTTTKGVFQFMSRSLSSIQEKSLELNVTELCRESLQKLIDLGLVLQTKGQSEDPEQNLCHSLEVTALGKATVKGPIDPDFSNRLYADLKKGEESLVLASHLHLLYLVTPYDAVKDVNPSWFIYFDQMSSLTPNDLKVASLIGVPESYIARQASQQRCRLKADEFTVKRFYLTLMLNELWNQRSVWEVAERFEKPRGFIQSLLSSAASFASCVMHFCQEMEEFWAYQDLMGNFVKRLSYCVTAELIPLVEIPGVKIGRAKLMYTAGYRTLSSVANADVESLVKGVQYVPRKVAKQIIASAKLLLNEKAEAMMEEVDNLVAIPEGTAVPVTMETMKTPAALATPSMSQSSLGSVT